MLRLPLFLLVCSTATAQSPAGSWLYNSKFFENDNYSRLQLDLAGTHLTGKLSDNPLDGTFQNSRLEATVTFGPDRVLKLTGTLAGDHMEGTGTIPQEENRTFHWTADRLPAKSSQPQTHTFEPKQFEHFFWSGVAPVLHLNPGDTVKTWSVDAGGTDPHGVRRTSGGNPLTGPFYIEGAIPGDTLAVHFTRIRLNRDTAISDALIVNSALNPGYIEQRKKFDDYNADWRLDRAAGFATLQSPTAALKNFKVPLAPMLGCVGVAPARGARLPSGNLGSFGGNMDYNQVREGVTVYLPVNAPGALLFMGDGHALQGAGELTGDALETSMDIEFTVDLIAGNAPPNPRMENSDYLMASGIAGSLDDAFRAATTNLVRWLEKSYSLNSAEASSVISTSVIYDIAEVVDGQLHVVAKVPKPLLAPLTRH